MAPQRPPSRSCGRNSMPVISGKRAFLELLRQEGIEILFGNPGTTELPLMDALAVVPELRYVMALQEAAVLAMADGYAQASGKLAFVNLHIAPGLGNAMGMLYDALKAGSPLLITAGQHDQSFTASEPILWADLPTMARPTGPVFLSLPADVLNAEADLELGAPSRVASAVRGDAAAIAAAAQLLAA